MGIRANGPNPPPQAANQDNRPSHRLRRLNGTGIPASAPAPNPSRLEAQAHEATATSSQFDAPPHEPLSGSLHGLGVLNEPEPSTPVFQGKDARDWNQAISAVLRRGASFLRFGRRAVKTGLGLSPANTQQQVTEPDSPHQPKHVRRTRQRTSAVSQAQVPTKRALLVTSDRSPISLEVLDWTAEDSKRVLNCLRTIGFQAEQTSVLLGNNGRIITEESFMGSLNRLLSGAKDGDMLVLFVSMHAFKISDNVYIVLETENQGLAYIGARELIERIDSILGDVCCTVEVVLDVCHAAGLAKYLRVIREMETAPNPVVIASAGPEASMFSPSFYPSQGPDILLNAPVELPSQYNYSSDMKATRHLNHAVATGPEMAASLPESVPGRVRSMHNLVAVTQSRPFTVNLKTRSTILKQIVWAAAKESQSARECTDESGRSNGALTYAMCAAIEESRNISRQDVFDGCVVPLLAKLNQPPDGFPLNKWSALELQHAQILSNRNDPEQILKGHIFQSLNMPKENDGTAQD